MPALSTVPIVRLSLVREGGAPYDATEHEQLSSSAAVYKLLAPMMEDLDREEFYVVALDGKNRFLAINCVSVGTLTASLVHPREIMKPLILCNAAAGILVHNHPSGDPTPSAEDIAVTTRLRQVGVLMGITILDHVVIGRGCYKSFADEGL